MPHDFVTTPFEGNLLSLLELLDHDWAPRISEMLRFHRWLSDQSSGNQDLYPLRKFSPSHENRGEILQHYGVRSVPVDNEPLVYIYEALKNRPRSIHALYTDSLEQALTSGRLPISWKLEAGRATTWSGAKVGGVATDFRKHGILLAHVLDAANQLPFHNRADLNVRFFRTLSPIFIFPWPSSRRTSQKILPGTPLTANRADLSGDPRIQEILFAFIQSKFSGALGQDFVKCCGDVGLLPNLPKDWHSLASSTLVSIQPKSNRTATHRNPTQAQMAQQGCHSPHAFIPTPTGGTEYHSLPELMQDLRTWAFDTNNTAVQLCGCQQAHNNPRPSFRLRTDCFADQTQPVPVITGTAQIVTQWISSNLSDFNGLYKIHQDTKREAIQSLIRLFDIAQSEEETSLCQIFDPAYRENGEMKLNLAQSGGAKGFYCYKVE